jgi:hypothetical protein
MKLPAPLAAIPRKYPTLLVGGLGKTQPILEACSRAGHAAGITVLPAVIILRNAQDEIYDILWALVFAFATINILGLGVRHLDPNRRGLSMGEMLAIVVVVVSVLLLSWEMLYLFHVLPIRLRPR